MKTFSQRCLERVTGITREQLLNWERGGYLRPARAGRRLHYSLAQAIGLAALGELRRSGVGDRRLREMAALIPVDLAAGGFLVIVGRMIYRRDTAEEAVAELNAGDRGGWVMRVRDLAAKLDDA